MPAIALPLAIPPEDLRTLGQWSRSHSIRAALAERAKILLLAAEGTSNTEIAGQVGCSRPTVILWRQRYAEGGLAGLEDQPRPGRPQTVRRDRRAEILATTLSPPPEHLGVTHWSTRLLADQLGCEPPHRRPRLGRARPQAVADRDLQVLHRPPAGSQGPRRRRPVPASSRTSDCGLRGREGPDPGAFPHRRQPAAASRQPRAAQPRLCAARHHHPVRGVGVATGKVVDQCFQQHRHTEFLAFLKLVAEAYPRRQLHLVVDNYGTHSHATVRAWLAKHPRVQLHFTPTSASWMNLVEVFFAIITRQAIRRGSFPSVADLVAAIGRFCEPGTSAASRFCGSKTPTTSWSRQPVNEPQRRTTSVLRLKFVGNIGRGIRGSPRRSWSR